MSQDDKSELSKIDTSENLELSPESLDSSLQEMEDTRRVQGEDIPPTDDSY